MLSNDDLVHVALVEPHEGTGAAGDIYGDQVSINCYFEGRRELVRDSSGEETVSEGFFIANPDVDVPVDSKVSILGRTTYVLSVALLDDGDGLGHIQVALA